MTTLDWIKNYRSSVLKFPDPYGSVLTKISKYHKIFNFWQITQKVSAYIPSWLTYLP